MCVYLYLYTFKINAIGDMMIYFNLTFLSYFGLYVFRLNCIYLILHQRFDNFSFYLIYYIIFLYYVQIVVPKIKS